VSRRLGAVIVELGTRGTRGICQGAEHVSVIGHVDRRHLQPLGIGQHRRDLRGTVQHRIFGVVVEVDEGGVHRPLSLGLATDTSRRVAVRVFVAPKKPSAPRHRAQLPPRLGEDAGRDECGNKEREPDANHGKNGITAQPGRNRVFPSKAMSFPRKHQAGLEATDRGNTLTRSTPARCG
jgi:hypothetical protein